MKTFLTVGSFIMLSVGVLAAEPVAYQSGPKNLVSPTYRAPVTRTVVPAELTANQVKRLTATAESAADHLKIARYYRAEAFRLDAKSAAYEEAAATYRDGPNVKNLMAPTTPARIEFFSKGFRAEAESDRMLAISHQEMAKFASGAGF